MRKAILFLVILLLVIAAAGAIKESNRSNLEVHLKKVELQDNAEKLKKLEVDYKNINGKNSQSEQQVKDLEQKRLQLEKEKADLEAQLQAKAELKANQAKVYAASLPTVPFTERASGCVTGYSTGTYALDQLISHESSGNSCSENAGGCYGLLQACPGAPLKAACGGDAACQIDWFTKNKLGKYGSWAAAWSFWQARVPINGRDVGNWW